MMAPVFFDDEHSASLYPFTIASSASTIRIGVLTIAEKWAAVPGIDLRDIAINARLIPDGPVIDIIRSYPGRSIVCNKTLLIKNANSHLSPVEIDLPVKMVEKPWQIFQWNGVEIQADIDRLKLTPKERIPWDGVHYSGTHPVYAAADAKVEPGTYLLAVEGPIVLGKASLVMAGSFLRGNVSVGDHAVIKMGAKIYADSTIGPECKAGGEIQNSVLMGYSNKGHDGYIGNSVLGRWCNMGAGTDTSNLKNNYSPVRVHNIQTGGSVDTGLQFCGTLMGDHSKTAIGTTLNTGTVVGAFANIAAGGFPDKHIPSFSWITPSGIERFAFDKAMDMARAMMHRRGLELSEQEIQHWRRVFDALR
jgi:UDP-N-acetylglucosamine diphosphorylase/glucosamine-1-phosphate N-acetyltransferase